MIQLGITEELNTKLKKANRKRGSSFQARCLQQLKNIVEAYENGGDIDLEIIKSRMIILEKDQINKNRRKNHG